MNRAFIGKNNVKKSFATLFQTGCALGRHVWNFGRGHRECVNRTISAAAFFTISFALSICPNIRNARILYASRVNNKSMAMASP